MRILADEDNWIAEAAGLDKPPAERPPLMYGHFQPWELAQEALKALSPGRQPEGQEKWKDYSLSDEERDVLVDGPDSDDERYAEGQREPGECRHCGQPIWFVYHGPVSNHTIEARPVRAEDGRRDDED